MILAMAQPDIRWTLLDSYLNKVRFIRHVKVVIEVSNVEIVHSRVESFKPEIEFETVICRAFAPLNRLLQQTGHLITKNNQLLAMKGKQVNEEIDKLGEHGFLIRVNNLQFSDDKSIPKLVQIRRSD